MANRITMSICGEDYTLVADESAAYMEKVGALVDEKMTQLQEGAHVSRIDAAVLTAVNLADELLKAQEAAENLRRQLKTYLDEASQAKAEASELKRQLFKAQQGHKYWRSCSLPPEGGILWWPPCRAAPTPCIWASGPTTPGAAPRTSRRRSLRRRCGTAISEG